MDVHLIQTSYISSIESLISKNETITKQYEKGIKYGCIINVYQNEYAFDITEKIYQDILKLYNTGLSKYDTHFEHYLIKLNDTDVQMISEYSSIITEHIPIKIV